jgi:hypothetical protein
MSKEKFLKFDPLNPDEYGVISNDDSTLEVSSNELKIKADGVTKTQINSDVAGAGLLQAMDGALDVNVDNSTIEIVSDVVQVKDGGITEAKLSTDVQTKLNSTSDTDFTVMAGEDLVIGDIVYLVDVSGTYKAFKAKADVIANCEGNLYFVKADASTGDDALVSTSGMQTTLSLEGAETFQPSKGIYLSAVTAGKVTQVNIPNSLNNAVYLLGYASDTASEWDFSPRLLVVLTTASSIGGGIVDFSAFGYDIIPDIDNTRSIGRADKTWKDIFVNGGSLHVGTGKILYASGKLQFQNSPSDPIQDFGSGGGGSSMDIEYKDSDFTAVSGKTYLIDTTNSVIITLPAASLNTFFTVKDETGSCSTNNITIQRSEANMIEGVAADRTLQADFGKWTFASGATNWVML